MHHLRIGGRFSRKLHRRLPTTANENLTPSRQVRQTVFATLREANFEGVKLMRTTLDLPEELLDEAMKVTQTKTKTGVIVLALEELVRKTKISELKQYKGKIDLDINLDELRDRKT